MKNFKALSVIVVIVLIVAGIAYATLGHGVKKLNLNTPGAKLIAKATQGQVKIKQEFKAIQGWNGFVVQPKQGGKDMIIFADKQGKYLFIGNIINGKRANLTQQFTQKFITSKLAKKAHATVGSETHWFVQGSDKAPHKMYVIIDPNCIYCHLLYKELQPAINSGKLQVRWIPVAILKATSEGKSAALMNAPSNKARVALLAKDEKNFNRATEEGGIKPLAKDSKSMSVSAAFSQVGQNTQFFIKNNFVGTPVLIYRNTKGQGAFYPGYLGVDAFKKLMKQISHQW